MKVLVAIKRVVDSNVRVRVRPDKVRQGRSAAVEGEQEAQRALVSSSGLSRSLAR